ncbi:MULTISPECIES: DUF1330 domain-containing protein [Pseudomonas]|uniref:DUF1330 domain-containing protein n=1 Tax=Pseudomonas TaxID=286 RepID=UPI0028945B7B|nr:MULTISPECIES: DUF1330 domain-containing protein [Pseudomonas]MDT3750526.1 DUF1330 domain-containing protein [Pseudomonas kurunegalensis]
MQKYSDTHSNDAPSPRQQLRIAAAREWYFSPAYQVALQHRLKGAVYRVFLIDGINY